MKRIVLQPAYVLHRRAYRESSFLVELFTKEHGRFTVVAKGVRKPRSSTQGLLQPFIPLLISCAGKGELLTLSQIEIQQEVKHLHGDCLFAGFYLNELLMALLQKWDAHSHLYAMYEKTLTALQNEVLEEKTLRVFEKQLLAELGYGLFSQKNNLQPPEFSPEKYYRFVPELGFVLSEIGDYAKAQTTIFSGKSLQALADESWSDEETLQDAKRLMRLVFAPLLQARTIYSRKLFG